MGGICFPNREVNCQRHISQWGWFSVRQVVNGIIPLKVATESVEEQLVLRAMEKYKNTYKAAGALGVSQSTVVRKMQKYG
ncbi:MAG: hypothetical protein GX376_08140 [Firmicutes bacterium]|nr:hypothetical protein [Bacillota bacterium]